VIEDDDRLNNVWYYIVVENAAHARLKPGQLRGWSQFVGFSDIIFGATEKGIGLAPLFRR
jgi:hypothetical protein